MLLDTSQPGWRILHSDCDEHRLSPRRTQGQALWDVFAVPDVVRPLMLAFPFSTQTAVFAYSLLVVEQLNKTGIHACACSCQLTASIVTCIAFALSSPVSGLNHRIICM